MPHLTMPLRIALVCSPRTGGSWIRMVLARALNLQEIAVHNWRDITSELPKDCILHIHWYREPNFQSFLRENEFRLIVLARHPLDVLLSVLHFIRYEPLTTRWLEGNCAIPLELTESSPVSASFNRYATSWGAENLLSISYQWWHDPAALKIRYEDFVTDPKREFTAIAKACGGAADGLGAVLQETNFKTFQTMPNHHGWQGKPAVWRSLLPATSALRIYAHHRRVFNMLGYPIPLSLTSYANAKRNWGRLKV